MYVMPKFHFLFSSGGKKNTHKLLNAMLGVVITLNLWESEMILTCPILFSENGIIVLKLHLTHTKL